MKPQHPWFRVLATFIASGVSCWVAWGAEAFHPSGDSTVVETLRTRPLTPQDRALRGLRQRQQQDPKDLPAALDLAKALIQRSRAEADPRFLAQSLVALSPWLDQPDAPAEVWVLRATVRQSLHEFDAALQDLDQALARDPKQVQAWLTKATLHTVRGEQALARKACLMLAQVADSLTATTAIAQLGSVTGNAKSSMALLEQALQQATNSSTPPPVDQQVWALTLLAETAARTGQAQSARQHFQSALTLAPEDPYLLGAYADFLLDQGQSDAVIDLLSKFPRVDALWLRVAEAGSRLEPNDDSVVRNQVRDLTARFEAARLRGDTVHRREEARFRMRLCADARGALELARDNWKVQREPADARILLEAARAAGDMDTLKLIETWLQTTKLEDVALKPHSAVGK
jgi:tetratricopeptide (TPR) repeat protein